MKQILQSKKIILTKFLLLLGLIQINIIYSTQINEDSLDKNSIRRQREKKSKNDKFDNDVYDFDEPLSVRQRATKLKNDKFDNDFYNSLNNEINLVPNNLIKNQNESNHFKSRNFSILNEIKDVIIKSLNDSVSSHDPLDIFVTISNIISNIISENIINNKFKKTAITEELTKLFSHITLMLENIIKIIVDSKSELLKQKKLLKIRRDKIKQNLNQNLNLIKNISYVLSFNYNNFFIEVDKILIIEKSKLSLTEEEITEIFLINNEQLETIKKGLFTDNNVKNNFKNYSMEYLIREILNQVEKDNNYNADFIIKKNPKNLFESLDLKDLIIVKFFINILQSYCFIYNKKIYHLLKKVELKSSVTRFIPSELNIKILSFLCNKDDLAKIIKNENL